MTDGDVVGLYGFRMTGSPLGNAAVAGAPTGWPTIHVTAGDAAAAMASEAPRVDAARAVVPMANGRNWLAADRAAGTAVFHGPPLEPDELAHPYLSPAAAIFARWHGREVFHGGAFARPDGVAIAVLGRRNAGKSTLLAALAARGVPVLADDLVVVEDGRVFAGPRTVDLRAEPGPLLTGGGALPVASARSGTRWRLGLPAAEPSLPLGGWVFLAAGDGDGPGAAPKLEPVQAPLGLSRIARSRGYPELASDPKAVLELAALPAIELHVPRSWTALERAAEILANRQGSA